MPLRFRRGTNAERLTITPAEGEPIYVTDTKALYIGDGTTQGGTLITSSGGGATSLNDLTDVDLTTPPTTGQVLKWDGSKFVAALDTGSGAASLSDLVDVDLTIPPTIGQVLKWDGNKWSPSNDDGETVLINGSGIDETQTYNFTLQGNVLGSDSSIIVDIFNNIVTADLRGSVFANDSSVLLDGLAKTITVDSVSSSTFTGPGNAARLMDFDINGPTLEPLTDNSGSLGSNSKKFGNGSFVNGSIDFLSSIIIQPSQDETGSIGTFSNKFLEGNFRNIYSNNLVGDLRGSVFADNSSLMVDAINAQFIGDLKGSLFDNNDNVVVDVINNIHYGNFDGTLTGNVVGDLRGSVFADDSSALLDAINRTIAVDSVSSPIFTGPGNAARLMDFDINGPTIEPLTNNSGSLGTNSKKFGNGSFVNGSINFLSSIIIQPLQDEVGSIGTFANKFAEGNFVNVYADNFEGNFRGTFAGDDSTILVDGINNIHYGNFEGDLIGNVVGDVTGSLTGDVTGNIFADNFDLLVDSGNNLILGNVLNDSVDTKKLDIVSNDPAPISVFATTSGSNGPNLSYNAVRNTIESPVALQPGDTIIDFTASGYDGTTDEISTAVIKMGVDLGATVGSGIIPGRILFLTFNSNGTTGINNAMVFNSEGRLGIKTATPAEALDVNGNGIFSGDVTAAAFKGSIMSDDSSTIIDGIDGTITAKGFIQFGSYTDAEISAITPINGMVYYNSTDNKFRGYQNGIWINLDDGTAA